METKDIIEYEGLYKISIDGNIYSSKRKGSSGGLVKQHLNKKTGYLYVNLFKNSKGKNHNIHRLIALHFIDNPNNFPIVDHIDRNKTNNSIDNLRWVSRQTNRKNQERYINGNTPEALEQRKERTRERARLWAQKNREKKRLESS
jgi:hypothetical protein